MISTSDRRDSLSFKVCICGQQGVGKTAMLNRRTSGAFHSNYQPTLAAAFATVTETIDNHTVVLNVWDTAGQEKYQTMMPLYFRDVSCVLLVLDVTSIASWGFVRRWIETKLPGIASKPAVIVAVNKTDLEPDIDIEQVDGWAADLGFPVVHTSAVTGDQIDEVFQGIAKLALGTRAAKLGMRMQTTNIDRGQTKCC